MQPNLFAFAIFLSILWFLVYWILGGVFFALIAILRLGRVRKVRFSCLFSLWALAIGIGAAFKGLEWSQKEVAACLADATNRAQVVVSVFGCGFSGVFGAFLIGAAVIALGGFLIFAISRTKSKPWIVLEEKEEMEGKEGKEEKDGGSKFYKTKSPDES